ncbi:lysylphosphatidylglycerol synthase transmembrane domain-containing protein [Sinorhizobium meliloti]|jgi:glycosyltransferase 2 family protein|uniref:lysylphosphatidylglycerol synthase transmembrane domain-containing protein n=1 Tax=Sinorhizobium TaxID=28105 RepID=UPI0023D84B57|nr:MULTISPECIES: YbhN family protein [Sinorhizobium]GCA48129.1 inner membrane protein YbhN [Sinorhizobium sp. KGO-5]WEJ10262.1 lysylphosphatidylglycerol synthase domain-containing protein [Sinorhizobium sp. M103]WEJ15176.1 lysylphosphatidylglycerol synthase domain-containing protein [Sinorhizobium sp. K101]WEJ37228.1 lysylphosphatidylglycerol synthase domain-containing protein [Sinorhizobium sp. C101]WRQ67760.1 YbhN family protein [Sinorhizobium meliloti]
MKRLKAYFWPVVGLAAILVSVRALVDELRGLSLNEFLASFQAISLESWLLAIGSTLVAYAALAAYDRLALDHLGHRISLWFITLCSFTTYALSHNLGASVFSGAVVRYRAYRSKGLTPGEVGVLVAFCSFTFTLGTLMLSAIVLLLRPNIIERFSEFLPIEMSLTTGGLILALIALYVLGSLVGMRPLRTRWFQLHYPRPSIVLRQLIIAPVELLGAAGIIYFALPEAGNPGYVVILGIFLASFSAALLSHAPGGIGVLEFVFIAALPEMDPADVLAALAIFRLLYLLVPFVLALVVILVFEHSRFLAERAAKEP